MSLNPGEPDHSTCIPTRGLTAITTIFLSYARDDDEPFVRRLYGDLTAAGFDVWWDREDMPSRALTFLQEIRDAISARDRLVLVVGPEALSAEYVAPAATATRGGGRTVQVTLTPMEAQVLG